MHFGTCTTTFFKVFLTKNYKKKGYFYIRYGCFNILYKRSYKLVALNILRLLLFDHEKFYILLDLRVPSFEQNDKLWVASVPNHYI